MTGVSQPIFPAPRAHRATRVRKYRVRNPFRFIHKLIPGFRIVFLVVIAIAVGTGIGASNAYSYVAGQSSVANPTSVESINGGYGDGYWIKFDKGPVVHTLSYREAIGQCFQYQKLKAEASCKGTTRSSFWWVHMFQRTLDSQS